MQLMTKKAKVNEAECAWQRKHFNAIHHASRTYDC